MPCQAHSVVILVLKIGKRNAGGYFLLCENRWNEQFLFLFLGKVLIVWFPRYLPGQLSRGFCFLKNKGGRQGVIGLDA